MNNRIIYYYQTFHSLQPLLKQTPILPTHIHLASFHFGTNQQKPYIHLNDHPPEHSIFKTVWKEIQDIRSQGVKIMYMIGGAGGAYTDLFSDFETYYKLLQETLTKFPYCDGIDLDVEEEVTYENIVKLIQRIKKDYPQFQISMAPVSSALETDEPGMGGFSYKRLMTSEVGKQINYLNGQFYGDDIVPSYEQVIQNGYKPNQIVYGMISSDGPFDTILKNISLLKKKYPNFGGVFIWEYFNAPPGNEEHPEIWSEKMASILHIDFFSKICNIS